MSYGFLRTFVFFGAVALSASVLAADSGLVLVIHGQQFEPQELALPPATKLKLVIRNSNAVPAEFESYDLSREIVIPGNAEATIYVGPLEPGRYQFFNDFNHAMQGTIVVKTPTKGN
ncbi:MAG: cupredoxin domain-containing protein [Sulfuriferula sp.]